MECPLCLAELTPEDFCELAGCGHRACICCFQQYLRVEITESRVCISCPECLEPMHPNEIRTILDNPALFEKYEDFMVRRVLAVDPDTRWCPAPDCCFAVIASECASCPKLKCERPGCDSYFCYHCKAEWHPNQTCDAARAQRSPNIRSSSITYSQDSQHRDDIKPCPRCQVLIVKMDDGSCNHMMCTVCGAEFCWLCMKEINDLHFLRNIVGITFNCLTDESIEELLVEENQAMQENALDKLTGYNQKRQHKKNQFKEKEWEEQKELKMKEIEAINRLADALNTHKKRKRSSSDSE
ncbi:hypothetical protein NQ314_001030 [Rhamnusium bicolor]|uniref:RBR-type E3 ubiquitin transferase n=1 Tax=Rhamnusium bicolor TaxID=1586634 RepID=A0AAV8ZW41_9CUCU|nr:hypothetical protein NQ314_001030 [Rhamnusium bicolor]